MNDPRIHLVEESDTLRAASVQVIAFAADPVMRWMWPEAHEYLRNFPALVRKIRVGASPPVTPMLRVPR